MFSATPSASLGVQNLVQEVLTWQKHNETQHLPKRYGVDDEQRKLGIRFAKLLLRRDKGLGMQPRDVQLSPAEVALVNSVPGVPLRGCSMQATPSNAYSGFEEPGANTAHVATEIASSGGPHPAVSTDSSQEPRSPMVFMKILAPIWASEVAEGQKMFECVANKTKWQNQFKQLSSGDLFIVVMKSFDKVAAVCEVASPAIVKETVRDVLQSKLQESRHAALDAYLDGAASFDYVEFRHVFDCRFFLPVSKTAAFLARVGLAHPKSPPVGLLRPVVIDAQWHIRLHEYMQQAVLRRPVDILDVSRQEVLMLEVTTWHYDAISSRRQRWEARPIFRDNNRGRGQSNDDKLATVGRQVILQKGPGTGRIRIADTSLWRIAEVRRYTSAQEMVSELAADLLPDWNDDRRRLEAYTDLYDLGCSRGFVAMRLELPTEAPAASQEQSGGDVHPAGIMPSERSSSRKAPPQPKKPRTCVSAEGC